MVKNPPANAGDKGDLGWEDPLEEEMTTHSNILAWKIQGTVKSGFKTQCVPPLSPLLIANSEQVQRTLFMFPSSHSITKFSVPLGPVSFPHFL